MNENEYRLMADVEAAHWWFLGLRDLLSRVLAASGLTQRPDVRVLDAGCGTGANLRLAGDLLKPSYLGGFDYSPVALELCREKAPEADLYQSDLCEPELREAEYDLILSCDVLPMTGLDAARNGLGRLAERLRPGGLFVINVAAYNWLYSAHDVATGSSERFTARQIGRLLEDMGLDRWLLTYRLCLLFPAIVLARLPSMIRRPSPASARSDLSWPPAFVNRCLASVVRSENAAIIKGVRLPWGSSVFAVGRRGSGAETG
ncbi:MAG TPA: class I SAM-dependent methyltransferase [Planctomycetaceae bacterium]|nr:class I SAM-dependent methyltransferase [Planctomycetaceae bacterium]